MNLAHDPTEALEGVLWSYRGRWLVLKDVSGLKSGHVTAKLDGDIVLHRSNVAFLQVLR